MKALIINSELVFLKNKIKKRRYKMKCKKCGAEGKGNFCEYCGTSLTDNEQTQQNYTSGFVCPKCKSNNVILMPVTTTYTKGKTKGFGFIKACIGWLLFSVPGILCGLCGMGKNKTKTVTTVNTVKVCQKCGFRF